MSNQLAIQLVKIEQIMPEDVDGLTYYALDVYDAYDDELIEESLRSDLPSTVPENELELLRPLLTHGSELFNQHFQQGRGVLICGNWFDHDEVCQYVKKYNLLGDEEEVDSDDKEAD